VAPAGVTVVLTGTDEFNTSRLHVCPRKINLIDQDANHSTGTKESMFIVSWPVHVNFCSICESKPNRTGVLVKGAQSEHVSIQADHLLEVLRANSKPYQTLNLHFFGLPGLH
jgi:hypothetical protein